MGLVLSQSEVQLSGRSFTLRFQRWYASPSKYKAKLPPQERGLTLPSSGPAFGRPLKSNVRAHMKHRSVLAPLLLAASSIGAAELPDQRAVEATARRTSAPVEQVREAAGTGCESGVTSSMNLCSEYHFVAADLRMNDAYAKARSNVRGTKAEPLLVKSQRSWLAFRDSTCEYESQGYEGGTLRGSISLGCMQAHTIERTRHLEEYLLCKSPGCPGEW